MNLHDLVIFLSLVLSPATIIMALGVCWAWHKSALESFKRKPKTDLDWFILGVFIGFFGSAIDNLYWGIAWTLDFADGTHRDWWFNNGAWSNLPFRQVCGLIAACCHIQAALLSKSTVLRTATWLSCILTVVYVVCLFLVD